MLSLGKVLGPSLSRDQITDGIEKLLDVYVENRIADESFLNTYQRIGIEKFKGRVYAQVLKDNRLIDDSWTLLTEDSESLPSGRYITFL